MTRTAIALGLLALTLGPAVHAQKSSEPPAKTIMTEDPEVLRGITGFFVVTSEMSDAGKDMGLSADTIKTKTELNLRRNGIKVYGDEVSGKAVGQAALVVRVTVLGTAAFINIECSELVRVIRPTPTLVLGAVTNSRGFLLTNTNMDRILRALDQVLDKLSNDYLKVNPPKPTAPKDGAQK